MVATPIGNLGDITDRARKVLTDASIIAAEDTRHAKKLLNRTAFTGRLLAYHDFSDEAQQNFLLAELQGGKTVALISDAGTPLISDPGFRLVRLARERGFPVLPVPGPSALTASLSVSGIATDRFVFEGFLPARESARRRRLAELSSESRTMVFYESPRRIAGTVLNMQECFGADRTVFIAREMTKKFEEHFLGTLNESLPWLRQGSLRQKGEFTLVLSGISEAEQRKQTLQNAVRLMERLQDDLPLSQATALVVEITGIRKNEIYKHALKLYHPKAKNTLSASC